MNPAVGAAVSPLEAPVESTHHPTVVPAVRSGAYTAHADGDTPQTGVAVVVIDAMIEVIFASANTEEAREQVDPVAVP